MIPKTACKYLSVTSIDLVNQCCKVFSWIPLTMVKSLLLNSACAYASSIINKFLNSFTVCGFRLQILRIPLTFADSTYILRNPLTVAESRTTSYICLLRNPQQIKCADKNYVTSICTRNPRKSCKWNPLTFWNSLNTCLWNPGTYRHKIVRLSSAQFGLVMLEKF